jgi:hypothetical protein
MQYVNDVNKQESFEERGEHKHDLNFSLSLFNPLSLTSHFFYLYATAF